LLRTWRPHSFPLPSAQEHDAWFCGQLKGISKTAQGTDMRLLLHRPLDIAHTVRAHTRPFCQLLLGQTGLPAIPL
jgi:hypothetical protein